MTQPPPAPHDGYEHAPDSAQRSFALASLEQGFECWKNGRLEGLRRVWTPLVSQDGCPGVVLELAAECWAVLGDWGGADMLAQRALANGVTGAEFSVPAAGFTLCAQRFEAGRGSLERALAACPDDRRHSGLRAAARSLARLAGEAPSVEVQATLQLEVLRLIGRRWVLRDQPLSLEMLAKRLRALGDLGGTPDLLDAHAALMTPGCERAALTAFDRALRLEPGFEDALVGAAMLSLRHDLPEIFVARCAALERAFPEHPELAVLRGHQALQEQRREEGIALLRNALDADPDRGDVLETLLYAGGAPDPAWLQEHEPRRRNAHLRERAHQFLEWNGAQFQNARYRLTQCDAGVVFEDRYVASRSFEFHEGALFGFLAKHEMRALVGEARALLAEIGDEELHALCITLQVDGVFSRLSFLAGNDPVIEPDTIEAFFPDKPLPEALVLFVDSDRDPGVTLLGVGRLSGNLVMLKTETGDLVYASDIGVADSEWR